MIFVGNFNFFEIMQFYVFGHYRTDVFGGISRRTGSAFRVVICREPMSDNKGLLLYFYLKKTVR